MILGAAVVLRIVIHSASSGRDTSRPEVLLGGRGSMTYTLETETGQIKDPRRLRAPSQGRGAWGLHQSLGRRAQGRGELAEPLQKVLAVQLLPGDATSCLNSFSFRGLFNISNKNKINNCTVYGNLRQK